MPPYTGRVQTSPDVSDQASGSGVRYISRSELVEVVCYDQDSKLPPSSVKSDENYFAKGTEKFARVKSPRIRRKEPESDDTEVQISTVALSSAGKSRRRTVTFNLETEVAYPSFETVLPPIVNKVGEQTSPRKTSLLARGLKKKAHSLDENDMLKLIPIDSPSSSPQNSPKLQRKSVKSAKSRPEKINVANISTESVRVPAPLPVPNGSRWERTESTLKKRYSLESLRNKGSSENLLNTGSNSAPTSPRTQRKSDKSSEDLSLSIDEFEPSRPRLRFIEAALSTTSPRFVRPASGASSRPSSGGSGRTSPISIDGISIDGSESERSFGRKSSLPGVSEATAPRRLLLRSRRERVKSPETPPNSRASTSNGSRGDGWKQATDKLQETIMSLISRGKGKWYD